MRGLHTAMHSGVGQASVRLSLQLSFSAAQRLGTARGPTGDRVLYTGQGRVYGVYTGCLYLI